jgi:hypothetical protein
MCSHHVNDAKRGDEQRHNNRREPIHRREDVVQRVVRRRRQRGHTWCRIHQHVRPRAEPTLQERVQRRIIVSTALERVLDLALRLHGLGVEDLLEVLAFLQGKEPDEGPDGGDGDGVGDQEEVEDLQSEGDVIALDDGADGDSPGEEHHDAEDGAACEGEDESAV